MALYSFFKQSFLGPSIGLAPDDDFSLNAEAIPIQLLCAMTSVKPKGLAINTAHRSLASRAKLAGSRRALPREPAPLKTRH